MNTKYKIREDIVLILVLMEDTLRGYEFFG